MKIKMFSYSQLDTFVHRLSGLTKLVSFLLLSFAVMLTYDYRVMVLTLIISLIGFKVAKIQFKQIRLVLYYVLVFLVINLVLTYLLAPEYGTEIYGSRHILFQFNSYYVVTQETLYYLVIKTLKYFSMFPLGLIFIFTTNPSEFASSLNHIGISYKICTTLSLTLRYFPDIIRDYTNISLAQQARGIELSKKEKFSKRFVMTVRMIIPLIFSTLDRVEVISNAMSLRGYGKLKKRSWYSYNALQPRDYCVCLMSLLVLILSLYMRFAVTKTMFYYPF